MMVTVPLLSHRDNNETAIYKIMPKMMITEALYQRVGPNRRGGL